MYMCLLKPMQVNLTQHATEPLNSSAPPPPWIRPVNITNLTKTVVKSSVIVHNHPPPSL